jgi:hypothetical protein
MDKILSGQQTTPQSATLSQTCQTDSDCPKPRETLLARLQDALARYERSERQGDLTAELAARRLLPHLVQIWYAEDAVHVHDEGHAGSLPYPEPHYAETHPLYVAELDD